MIYIYPIRRTCDRQSGGGDIEYCPYLATSSSCLYLNMSLDAAQTLGFRWFLRICQWAASTARSSDQDIIVLDCVGAEFSVGAETRKYRLLLYCNRLLLIKKKKNQRKQNNRNSLGYTSGVKLFIKTVAVKYTTDEDPCAFPAYNKRTTTHRATCSRFRLPGNIRNVQNNANNIIPSSADYGSPTPTPTPPPTRIRFRIYNRSVGGGYYSRPGTGAYWAIASPSTGRGYLQKFRPRFINYVPQ